jgi:hypothetical protein
LAQASIQEAEARSCPIKGAIVLAAAAGELARICEVPADEQDPVTPLEHPGSMVQLLNNADAAKQFMTCLKRQAEVAVLLEKCRLEDIASEVRKASQKLRAALERGITTHVLCLEESTKRALSALKDARTLPRIIVEPVVEPRTAESGKGKEAETSELKQCAAIASSAQPSGNLEMGDGNSKSATSTRCFERLATAHVYRNPSQLAPSLSTNAAVCAASGHLPVSTGSKEPHCPESPRQGTTYVTDLEEADDRDEDFKEAEEKDADRRHDKVRVHAGEDSECVISELELSGGANDCQTLEKRPAKRQKTTKTAEDNEMRGGLLAFRTSSASASSAGAEAWSASSNASSPSCSSPPPPHPPASSVQARLDRLLASFVAQNRLEGRLPLLCFSMLQSHNFLKPCSVAFDQDGSLLIADCLNNRVVPW